MRRRWVRRRFRPDVTSGCTWSATSRVSTPNAGSSGVGALVVAQGVSASADDGAGAGPLLAVEDAKPAAARGPRGGVRLVLARIAEHGLVKASGSASTPRSSGLTRGCRPRPRSGRSCAVDLDTGAVVAAEIHPADDGDTTTLSGTLKAAAANLAKVDRAPSTTETAELVADKGYHSRAVLKDLDGTAFLRWRGDTRRGMPSTPTATGCARRSASRACGNGRKSSNDRSLTTWSAAACGELGCAGARTSTNAT